MIHSRENMIVPHRNGDFNILKRHHDGGLKVLFIPDDPPHTFLRLYDGIGAQCKGALIIPGHGML